MKDKPVRPQIPDYDKIIKEELKKALEEVNSLVKSKRGLLGLRKMDLQPTELQIILKICEAKTSEALSNATERMQKEHLDYLYKIDDYEVKLYNYIGEAEEEKNTIITKQNKAIADFNLAKMFYDAFQELVKEKNIKVSKILDIVFDTSDATLNINIDRGEDDE